jgi:DNA-binding response OmpR family regulator
MPCRVLIVEDQPDLREMMAQMLTLEGFDAVTATDGIDALGKLQGAGPPPNLILLDMMMPRMDGWTFVENQTRNPAIAAIPVVVLSAVPRDHLRGVRAAAVLQKPLNFDNLLATIRTHC